MADEDNIVVRLLREIRGDTSDLKTRMTKMERHLSELREHTVTAMGMAAMASQTTEDRGERLDEITDELEALRRRVADLEAQK
ncbi:MAG: hypothetical protein AAGJ96_07995 [Pseudomonadota bacterium]